VSPTVAAVRASSPSSQTAAAAAVSSKQQPLPPPRNTVTPDNISDAKASYLCVKASVAEDLESAEELQAALQYCGFNPTDETIEHHWNGSRISFQQYDRIVGLKQLPGQDDLINSFRKFDPSGTGKISRQRLTEALTCRGEKLSSELVDKYIGDPDFSESSVCGGGGGGGGDSNGGNNQIQSDFNYSLFLDATMKTRDALLKQVKAITADNENNFAINSKTYTKVRRKSSSPQKHQTKSTLTTTTELVATGSDSIAGKTVTTATAAITTVGPEWKTSVFSKGAFFFEGESLISHQFNLEIQQRQRVQISIQSLDNKADCQLFIFKINEVVINKNSESRYLLVERTPMTMPHTTAASGGRGGAGGGGGRRTPVKNVVSWTGHLDKGSYLLVPSTTGCKLRKRKAQPSPEVELVTLGGGGGRVGGVELSPKFRSVLTEIFEQIDLDASSGLSRQEFNLFNWRTSGEEVQDEEWRVVQDNFDLINGDELTLKGFLRLHQMEAEDNSGDSAELWVTLNAMGYNYNLQQDEAALFQVTVRGEHANQEPVFYVSGLRSGGSILDKATIRCIMEGANQPQIVSGSKDILIFREDLADCCSVVIQNKSCSTVALNMDFGRSDNVMINHPHMSFSTTLSARSTLFVAHLIPDDLERPHNVALDVRLLVKR